MERRSCACDRMSEIRATTYEPDQLQSGIDCGRLTRQPHGENTVYKVQRVHCVAYWNIQKWAEVSHIWRVYLDWRVYQAVFGKLKDHVARSVALLLWGLWNRATQDCERGLREVQRRWWGVLDDGSSLCKDVNEWTKEDRNVFFNNTYKEKNYKLLCVSISTLIYTYIPVWLYTYTFIYLYILLYIHLRLL
jgi:hypothetical protein